MSVLEKKIKLCFKMQAGVSRCCKLRHVFMVESWSRGRSRANATSKMECFAIIVNGFQPLTIITKHSLLDVAAALDPPSLEGVQGVNSLKKFDLFTSGRQVNSLKKKKPCKLIYFECKLNINML